MTKLTIGEHKLKSIDWQDFENYRNHILAELFEFATDHGLSAEAGETEVVIHLPTVQEINVWPEDKKRKFFDFDAIFPSNGMVEGDEVRGTKGILDQRFKDIAPQMPDELEPPNYTLDEGEPPKGDNEA